MNLHHAVYPTDGKFLMIKDDQLVPLCEGCHMEFHNEYGSSQDMYDETIEFINKEYDGFI